MHLHPYRILYSFIHAIPDPDEPCIGSVVTEDEIESGWCGRESCVLDCVEMLTDVCTLIPLPRPAKSSQGVLPIFVDTTPFPGYCVRTGPGSCGCISKSMPDSSLFDVVLAMCPGSRRDELIILGENGPSLSFCIVFRAKPQVRRSVPAEGP